MGEKKIGLAIGDSQFKIVSPLKIIPNNSQAINEIVKIMQKYSVELIVMGFPIFPVSKKPNELMPSIKNFSNRLKKQIKNLLNKDVEIKFVEEEYTTEIAKIRYGVSKEVDKLAAAVILEQYFNGG